VVRSGGIVTNLHSTLNAIDEVAAAVAWLEAEFEESPGGPSWPLLSLATGDETDAAAARWPDPFPEEDLDGEHWALDPRGAGW
jgi:hypothetical protein